MFAAITPVSAATAKKVSLSKKTATITVGQAITLKATVTPASLAKSLKWKTSDSKVATVSKGKVTGKKAGKATITAYAGSVKATCVVTVKKAAPAPAPTPPPSGPSVKINASNFPDQYFRLYIANNLDMNKDGVLSAAEIANVIHLDITGDSLYATDGSSYPLRPIFSLKGIEYFTELTDLRCGLNSLTNLDVSKNTKLTNLDCRYNFLTALDVSKNTKLEILECSLNKLTALDVSHNPALRGLCCYANDYIAVLDISKNTKLDALNCSLNALSQLDVSKNTSLRALKCNTNNLSQLDVSKNAKLVYFDCSTNQLTQLDISKNTALEHLSCRSNQLTQLDISQNKQLKGINCFGNAYEFKVKIKRNTIWFLESIMIECKNNEIFTGANRSSKFDTDNWVEWVD